MNYFRKTFSVDNLTMGYVFRWIAEHPNEHPDHTTFQDTNKPHHYYMVSETGDDCGFEKNVSLGIDKWSESGIEGVLFNEDRNIDGIIVKAHGTYYFITH